MNRPLLALTLLTVACGPKPTPPQNPCLEDPASCDEPEADNPPAPNEPTALTDREVWAGTFEFAQLEAIGFDDKQVGSLRIIRTLTEEEQESPVVMERVEGAMKEFKLAQGDERWTWQEEAWPKDGFIVKENMMLSNEEDGWQEQLFTHETFGPSTEPVDPIELDADDRFYKLEVGGPAGADHVGWLHVDTDEGKLKTLTWYMEPTQEGSLIVLGGGEFLKLSEESVEVFNDPEQQAYMLMQDVR